MIIKGGASVFGGSGFTVSSARSWCSARSRVRWRARGWERAGGLRHRLGRTTHRHRPGCREVPRTHRVQLAVAFGDSGAGLQKQ